MNAVPARVPSLDAIEPARAPAAIPPIESEETRDAIEFALGGLEEDLRLPIVLHYLQGFSQTEVGQMLGVSQSMAAKRIAEGLEALRRRLARERVALSGAALPVILQQGGLLEAPASLRSQLLDLSRLPVWLMFETRSLDGKSYDNPEACV